MSTRKHSAGSTQGAVSGSDSRSQWLVATLVSGLFLGWYCNVDLGLLADTRGWASFREMLGGLAAPDLSDSFLRRIAGLAVESLLIGILGTALALVFAIPLAIFAARMPALQSDPARRFWPRALKRGLRTSARGLLAFYRSVPEIIWAFLFVRIFGLGPGPAVFAIAITFCGIIGKLFAEIIEAADPEPARRLRAVGASSIGVFVYGVLPLVRRQWIAYALFRLECAIRSASILGVVGAGGLGQEIDLSIRYFQYDKLATALLAVLAYVVILELASVRLRKARPIWPIAFAGVGAIAALALVNIPWSDLGSSNAIEQARAFLSGFSELTTDTAFLRKMLGLALTTVAMAWVATLFAAIIALALAPMSATTFTIGRYLKDAPRGRGWTRWLFLLVLIPARLSLQIMRALPELVWAMLLVVWTGPGITAGVLALTIHTIGVLGRLYGDALEEAEPGPAAALEASGARPLARYLYGVFPQALPRMLSFTLFRFEVNVRAAAMVGFVGAGGLGDALHTAISLFHMQDLATLLLLTIAVVVLVDALGDRIRLRVRPS